MLLAVCIPTHDGRAGQLRHVLDSIAPEIVADERVLNMDQVTGQALSTFEKLVESGRIAVSAAG